MNGEPNIQHNYCDRVIGVVHTAADHDACERRRIDALRARQPDPVSRDRYTVSGNAMRVWHLDAEGNPVGEPIDLNTLGRVSFDIDAADVADADIDGDEMMLTLDPNQLRLNTFTADIEFNNIDPAVMFMLTGQGTPPDEITVYHNPSIWWLIKRWLKGWWKR